jgi:hypothetical protein
MSEPDDEPGPENFLQRWSRRKQAAALRARNEDEVGDAGKTDSPSASATANPSDPPAFDPAALPPLESITATSDIRAFLAPGVPAELSRAALRRVWVSDPAIRDFIGIAENQWDFNNPDSVPGFGSLELTPELRRMVNQLVGGLPNTSPPSGDTSEQPTGNSVVLPPPATPGAADTETAAECSPALPAPQLGNDAATQTEQHDAEADEPSVLRKHGSAVPR